MTALPLFDAPPKPKLSSTESRVLSVIQAHRRHDPVTMAEVQRITGLSRRTVFAAVEQLVLEHRHAIGSSRGKVAGFWLAVTREDREAAARVFRRQAISELRRLSVLLDRRDMLELAGQLRISDEGAL